MSRRHPTRPDRPVVPAELRVPRWWQRRCTGRLVGPPIIGAPEWRCDLRRGHPGDCHFDPDDWPELAAIGGWRGLRDDPAALRLRGDVVDVVSDSTPAAAASDYGCEHGYVHGECWVDGCNRAAAACLACEGPVDVGMIICWTDDGPVWRLADGVAGWQRRPYCRTCFDTIMRGAKTDV